MTIDQIIDQAGQANSAVLSALQALQENPRVNDRLVITSCMRALERCVKKEPLSDTARKQAASALEMCRASLGLA